MAKIFIIEDELLRINWFKKNFTHCDLTIAIDIDEAKKKFSPPYDLVFFDHDLGGRTYVPSDDRNTGWQFAKHVCEFFPELDTDFIVHSLNEVGAANIVSQLQTKFKHVHRIPYYQVMTDWKYNRMTICGKKRSEVQEW